MRVTNEAAFYFFKSRFINVYKRTIFNNKCHKIHASQKNILKKRIYSFHRGNYEVFFNKFIYLTEIYYPSISLLYYNYCCCLRLILKVMNKYFNVCKHKNFNLTKRQYVRFTMLKFKIFCNRVYFIIQLVLTSSFTGA